MMNRFNGFIVHNRVMFAYWTLHVAYSDDVDVGEHGHCVHIQPIFDKTNHEVFDMTD